MMGGGWIRSAVGRFGTIARKDLVEVTAGSTSGGSALIITIELLASVKVATAYTHQAPVHCMSVSTVGTYVHHWCIISSQQTKIEMWRV